MRYAQYSPGYILGTKLIIPDIRRNCEQETMSIVQPSSFCEIWQLHALTSVIRVYKVTLLTKWAAESGLMPVDHADKCNILTKL